MKHLTLIVFASLLFIKGYGQQFTDVIRTQSAKGGVVVLIQSSKIDSLVNGVKPKVVTQNTETKINVFASDSVQLDSLGFPIPKGFITKDGFRIQIFTGGNSRQDKDLAIKLQHRSQELFPGVKAYCNFISPRWVVRIGDFATRDEAMMHLEKVRETGISKEVRLVKCKVQIPVY